MKAEMNGRTVEPHLHCLADHSKKRKNGRCRYYSKRKMYDLEGFEH